jgi:translation initiation factor 3 subunit L
MYFHSYILSFDACVHRQEALGAFEELFLYACPKFISANSPPYEDATAIATLLQVSSPADSTNTGYDATQRHLALFLSDAAAQLPVPTLRSFLKLYTSLDAKKLSNFLDADEEEMVQEMMVMKQASKSLSRVPGGEFTGLLDGQMITTSDLNFVIDEVSLFIIFEMYKNWLTCCSFRTWSILRNRQLVVVTRGGSSKIPNAHKKSLPT